MKKICIILLAMLSCVASAYAQNTEGNGGTSTDELVYITLEGTAGISNSNADHLLDGDSTTKWCPNFTKKQEGETTNGAYVIFKTSLPIVPTHYTLTTADDTKTYPARNWKQWQLYGMNAGSDEDVKRESGSWVVLDKKYNIGQDQLPATNYTSVEFSLSEGNTTPYMYFKIEVDDIFGSTYCMQMADFLLDGIIGTIPFADVNVKAICVSNWDTDGDGEMSMEEVAAVTTIGEVFKNNNDIITFKELQFFTGLSNIDDDAFNGCSSLTSVTFPKSVTSIGNHAFDGCSSLTSITIPEGVTSIGNHAFDGCSSLSSVTLPKNVTTIADYAFNGCSNITSIIFPENLTSIGQSAFGGCIGLTSIIIPVSVTEIGEDAFNECSKLASVEVKNPTPVAISQNTFSNRTNAILIVPAGCGDAYLAADYWNEFKEIVAMDDIISFADANVKAICVSNWDTNRDGELSYAEAAAVTSLGEVFRGNSSITSFNELQYFKGLKTIEDYTFYYCSCLTSIIIPNSVTTIGNIAFTYCSGLTSITIPNSVTIIGNSAFSSCSGLTSVTIPNSVTFIGNSVFSSCTGLTSVIIGNSVTSIGNWAFEGCTNLASITISHNVKSIDESAFFQCYGLKDVKVVVTDYSEFCNNHLFIALGDRFNPRPIQLIDNEGNEITEFIIPEGVTTIGAASFANCSGLTSIIIPNSVKVIEDAISRKGFTSHSSWTDGGSSGVFQGCSALESITIPNSVTSIGGSAFAGCSGLTSVTIPNSVTSIGSSAFSGCSGLTSITIPNSVTTIGENTFSGCSGMTSVTIPNSVTTIRERAFYGCKNLTSAKIGNGVSSIGNSAFANCENLASVKMGRSVSSIGEKAFQNCSSLTSVTLPNNLESIGAYAFNGCSLTSIDIPGSVKTIDNNAFKDCSSLVSVSLEDGITSIGDHAFYGCSFTSITIPNSVTKIQGFAFANNVKLTTAILGDGITKIEGCIFQNCRSLSTVVIPNGVTSIGNQAFLNCALTSIKLPESLTSIEVDNYGSGTFGGCPLKSIELPDAFTIIPENLFRSNSFQYIKLGNNVKSIGKNAFGSSSEPLLEIGTSTPPAIDSNAFPNIAYLSDLNVIVPDSKAETAYRKADVWQEMTFSNQINVSEVTVETPGDLSFELITQCNMMPAKVVGLKVNGTINAEDFTQMRVNMKSLLRLDLSDCNITEIPEKALNDKIQLQELTLPTKLQTIGKSAFQGCTGLTSAIWGNQLTTIGESAFQGCTYLSGELNLPSTLTSIGKSAFMGTYYTSVKLPSTLKTIGDYAFNNVPINQQLKLPSRVTSVGTSAFAGTKITGLEIPDGMTSIGDYAFAGTPIQGHVTIPDGITYLGKGAFQNSQLSTVFLPNSVTELSQGLFQGCPNLDLVYVPDNYTGVSNSAFSGCGALTILRLSANLESMGAYSFQSTPLEYIKVPSQVEVLSTGVLKNCRNLASLSLPANLKTVEAEALYGCTALRNLSIEAIDPPTIKDKSALRGINTDLCLISIPTQSFRAYVLAEYWGQFVQMRNDIAVETSGNGEIAFESVDEDEEEVDEESPNLSPSFARGRKRVSELASADEESMTYVSNGSSVYVPQQGQVRFYIIPAEGERVLSATLDGEDIMPYIVDGVYTATADKKNAKLVVVFSDGQGSAGLMGDVNGDGDVSVTDVGCVINYILEQVPDPFIPAAADMNSDGSISVTDVGFIINYILNDGAAFCRAEHKATYSYGEPMLIPDTDGYVLTLDGADAFIAFQMDIFVQEDADGYNVRLKDTGTDHQMVCRRLSNGHFRVVCYSPTNETFREGLTDLLTFASEGDMTISNIRFTTESLDEVRFADMSATPTSIASVTDLKTTDIKVYTLDGQLYRTVHARQGENPLKDLQPGIYLINNRKYIIR